MNDDQRKPMTRSEIIDEVIMLTEVNNKALVKNIITAYENIIMKDLTTSLQTKIGPMGKLKIKKRNERVGQNPSTGEQVIIPAKMTVKFSASKGFKEYINKYVKI